MPFWSLSAENGSLEFRYNFIASSFEGVGNRPVSDWAPTQLLFALFKLSFERMREREAAVEALLAAANAGCLPAMVYVARNQVRGTDLPRDVNAAEAWLNKAADANYVPALRESEEFYDYRQGIRPDLKRHREVLAAAVRLNVPGARLRLNNLPKILFEDLTVHDLFSLFLAEWGEPTPVHSEWNSRLLISGPSPVLARYDDLEKWLRPFADPVVRNEKTISDAYKAQCMLGALLVRDIYLHRRLEGLSLLRSAADAGGWDAAALLYAEHRAMREDWSAPEYYLACVEHRFAPALRMQALISLDWDKFHYDRVFQLEADTEKFKLERGAALKQLVTLAEASDIVACRALIAHYARDDRTEERKWIVKGANLGDPTSLFELAQMYERSELPSPAPDSAIKLFQRCVVEADSVALAANAEQKIAAIHDAPYIARALALIADLETSLTKHGHYARFLNDHPGIAGLAQRAARADEQTGALYGLCLIEGHGITRSISAAKRVLLAADDSAPASFLYGWINERGLADREDFRTDLRTAVWTYQTVANVGGVYAAYRLAEIQSHEGDYLDRDKAFKNFTTAAEAGCIPAMVGLARAYKDGLGVTADAAKAKEWARKAADEGNLDAEALLKEWE